MRDGRALPCGLPQAEADTLNRERGRIYTDVLVWHYRIYRRTGHWLSPGADERLNDTTVWKATEMEQEGDRLRLARARGVHIVIRGPEALHDVECACSHVPYRRHCAQRGAAPC